MKKIFAMLLAFCVMAIAVKAQEAVPVEESVTESAIAVTVEKPAAPEMKEAEIDTAYVWYKDSLMPGLSFGTEWRSKYVSKGVVYNPDPILTLDAEVTWLGMYAYIWDAIDMTGYNNANQDHGYMNDRRYRSEEYDIIFGYRYTFDELLGFSPLSLNFGWERDNYPNLRDNVHYDEASKKVVANDGGHKSKPYDQYVTMTASLDDICETGISFGTEFNYDVRDWSWYGNIGAGYEYTFEKIEKLSVGVESKAYWRDSKNNHHNSLYGDYNNGFTFNTIDVVPYAEYKFTEHMVAKAYVAGAWGLCENARHALRDDEVNNSQNFWCGCSLGFSF